MEVTGIVVGMGIGMVMILTLEIAECLCKRFAPQRVKNLYHKTRYYLLWPYRRAVPDSLYKLWLETGIMEQEAYRQFQERGIIQDDLDPEYISQSESE